jgi:hypothetical protein
MPMMMIPEGAVFLLRGIVVKPSFLLVLEFGLQVKTKILEDRETATLLRRPFPRGIALKPLN